MGDDVSALTDRLTVWEWQLFWAGASAVQQWENWQQQGKRRTAIRRVVTPTASTEEGENDKGNDEESPSKRPRLQ